MSIDEFVVELAAVADKFEWKVSDWCIRGTTKSMGPAFCFCPITAVEYLKGGLGYTTPMFWAAARNLGMDDADAAEVATTSDAETTVNRELRARLLVAVGLDKWERNKP